ncbi:MAG: ThiF family adenylyltransferase [Muribaculaceae bacterium]|nr:ThiF family adenylyltransferase [Muribaculaceae bacterium]
MTSDNEYFGRERLVAGDEMMEVLAGTRVLVFGIGGVGSWCVEALARSAVGHICICLLYPSPSPGDC